MELTASSHPSCFVCPIRESRDKRFYRSQSPLGLGGRSDEGSRILCPSMVRARLNESGSPGKVEIARAPNALRNCVAFSNAFVHFKLR